MYISKIKYEFYITSAASIATIVIFYILKIGLNVYCKSTDAVDGGTLPPGK
ncbi:hypothetical protein [Nostoc sp.]|uniref:hypothetical protein n=1 Tax=Nostoc sp. TaxID=1180 RepID=UPI002FF65BB7